MNATDRHEGKARLAELGAALAFAEAFGVRNGLAHDDGLRLTLVIEELFTNTVVHGHGGDTDAPVSIALALTASHVLLCYEDSAPPFDPLEALARDHGAPDLPVDESRVGGQGVRLVSELAETLRYSREQGRNRLTIELPRRG
jgi:serine/threonine-protein kinase RsbW